MKVYNHISEFKGVNHAVVTVGTFDGVHIGHQKIIARLKEIAQEQNGETVLLTFYPHPRMILFPDDTSLKLINTMDEKIKLLESYGLDHLIIYPFEKDFSRITPTEYVRDLLVKQVGVKTLVIGYDHRFGRNRQGNFELLEELSPVYDFDVKEISAQEINDIRVSSTKVRKSILEGDIETATNYLGHAITFSGKVVKGDQLGRTIGYPTANIELNQIHKLIPEGGVYAIKSEINGLVYNGMLNIGQRPTVGSTNKTSIEAHFFNLDEDLYDREITIELVAKLRDEKKYMDLEELKDQLDNDKNLALSLLQ